MTIEHLDAVGKPITIGCSVATNIDGYVYQLFIGKVVDLTPQKVRVEYVEQRKNKIRTTLRFPMQLVVVDKEPT